MRHTWFYIFVQMPSLAVVKFTAVYQFEYILRDNMGKLTYPANNMVKYK